MSLPSPGVLGYLFDWYEYIVSLRDPRTLAWGLTADLRFMLPISFSYLYIVKVGGPRWMTNRKPFSLKRAIMAYNLCQVIANVFFFVQYMRYSYLSGNYNLLCQGVTYSTDESAMVILTLHWWYGFVRIADFVDTFFLVASKKFAHITFLHVIHHFLVVLDIWLWLSFGSDGQAVMVACFNSFVHVVMYGYYFVSALGPGVREHLWWKKHLTGLQIFQIAFLMVHMCIPLVYDCGYPRILIFLSVAQALMGLGLFINFYTATYVRRPKKQATTTRTMKSE